MIIIKNNFIPFQGYKIINLFGILFIRDDINRIEYNHEGIHTVQLIECMLLSMVIIAILSVIFNFSFLWVLLSIPMYYIQYGLEYCCIRLFHKKQGNAYHDVSFEEEAYNNENDLDYLKNRTPFAWIKYVKLKSN